MNTNPITTHALGRAMRAATASLSPDGVTPMLLPPHADQDRWLKRVVEVLSDAGDTAHDLAARSGVELDPPPPWARHEDPVLDLAHAAIDGGDTQAAGALISLSRRRSVADPRLGADLTEISEECKRRSAALTALAARIDSFASRLGVQR